MTVDLERLTREFPPDAIQTRQGGGSKPLRYVAGHTVIRRLNEATDNTWDWHIIKLEWRVVQTQKGPVDELVCYGELSIPGHGTRAGIGVQRLSAGGGEDLAKGASTDALKKAAWLFGVGIELSGPDIEGDGEITNIADETVVPPLDHATFNALRRRIEAARTDDERSAVSGTLRMTDMPTDQREALREVYRKTHPKQPQPQPATVAP